MEPRNLAPLAETFDGLYGLEVTSVTDEEVRGRVDVRPELKQAAGLLHGGVLAAMAESLASMATWLAVRAEGRAVMGMANATSFLRPITEGSVSAVGRARHRGRTTWVWDVDFTDDAGRLCATTRMTIAVR
ncbi:MAG TPA: PaaI family thioesterase [Solirubrobacteraceae bacterium]|nr:PaaI family thioesterase [Solirubrobacteraceae bacterium]